MGGLVSKPKKPDTSAADAQIKAANEAAAKAKKDADAAAAKAKADEEAAKNSQKDAQDQILSQNKEKRASAASRFSLLLFDDKNLLGG